MPTVHRASLEANPYRTAQAVVADRLRRAVLSGQVPPGSRLLQAAIATEMRTSTTPVREAMRELAGEGLLDLDPHRGVVVHRPSMDELQEVYRIRLVLEPVAIAATVENITPRQLAVAEEVLEWAILNASYHSLLAEATAMPIMTSVLAKLRNITTLYVASLMHQHPDRLVTAQGEHRAMLEACKAGDVKKAQEVEVAHLRHTLIMGEDELAHRPAPSDP
jgi:DNA-binding GntR family transcriptional regulator